MEVAVLFVKIAIVAGQFDKPEFDEEVNLWARPLAKILCVTYFYCNAILRAGGDECERHWKEHKISA